MQRLHESGIVGVVAERSAQPLDRRIQTVLEIDKRAGRPQTLAQLLARDDFTGALEHERENFERLILKPDPDAAFAKLARAKIDFERSESLDGRRPFQRQHLMKFSSPRPVRAISPVCERAVNRPRLSTLARHQRFASRLPAVH